MKTHQLGLCLNGISKSLAVENRSYGKAERRGRETCAEQCIDGGKRAAT
jgi:hypothetical protein